LLRFKKCFGDDKEDEVIREDLQKDGIKPRIRATKLGEAKTRMEIKKRLETHREMET
jgi:hypothetical protein